MSAQSTALHWASYWQSGVEDSFGGHLPPWYRAVLEPFWKTLFASLPKQSAVLDLAAGNGAVALMAARVSRDNGLALDICATDKSALSPKADQGIKFFPNQALESLSLGNRQFDLACAQFGLEYAAPEAALKSISQILVPAGRLVAVCHDQQSIICTHAKDELRQYRALKKELPLLEVTRDLLLAMGEVRSPADLRKLSVNPRSESKRRAFNRTLDRLMRSFPQGVVLAELILRINPLFKERVTLPLRAKLQVIEHTKQQMMLAELRLIDLVNAALDDKSAERLILAAHRHGLSLEAHERLEDGMANQLGRVLKFRHTSNFEE